MCDHFLGFHTRYHLQQPRALWRCSACGRESAAPIDCCVQPDFASLPCPGVLSVYGRWLRGLGARALTRIRCRRLRRAPLAVDVDMTPDLLSREELRRLDLEPVTEARWREASAPSEADDVARHVSV